ncbi:MAG: hypothetical protein RMI80_10435, partial [Meiothermus sp.]|uniref:hypothetical protein n=1 Tax=Meiothermus sp. TaxID=1955249 RepID=UPI00298F3959
MEGATHFKNMPHYRLEGPLGKRRWHYIGPEEKKQPDSHHYFAVEEALKQITPQHILDGFHLLGSGFNGAALAFESPIGPLVVKNAYPVRGGPLGVRPTSSTGSFHTLNRELMKGLGMELPELDEFVQRSKAILGTAAIPTVYTAAACVCGGSAARGLSSRGPSATVVAWRGHVQKNLDADRWKC